MKYFHTDDVSTMTWLENVLSTARTNGQAIRLAVDENNALKVKVGGGIWTAPIDSTYDFSRDPSHPEIVIEPIVIQGHHVTIE